MRIYLTNLGKYNEGDLVGEWLELPATEKEIEESFKRIGIDGINYEEYFITDYEDSIFKIEEYSNLEYLNEIAEKIENLNDDEKIIFQYLKDYQNYDFEKTFEIIENENYLYYANIKNEEDLGEAISEDWEIPENLINYIDYEAIGRDATFENWDIYKNIAICLY